MAGFSQNTKLGTWCMKVVVQLEKQTNPVKSYDMRKEDCSLFSQAASHHC